MKYLKPYEKQELVRLSGKTTNARIAAHFGVCERTVQRILTRIRKAGINTPPRASWSRRPKAVVKLEHEEEEQKESPVCG